MSFTAYLKYQPKVISMLLNSYKKERLAHAYLFEGEKGTQKKEIALELAKLLYCEGEEKPCETCINCLRIEHNNHPNVLIIEPDNNTIKKEQVLYLQEEYSKTTLEPGPKVYIIDDADKMSANAANSILKFIEEPQPDTYTILITDNVHKLLPTIISRCQVLTFQPISHAEVIQYLIEHGVDVHTANVVSQLTSDLDKALEIASSESMPDLIDLVSKIGWSILTKNADPVMVAFESKCDIYSSDKKLTETFLDILLAFMRDVQKADHNNDNLIFARDAEIIKQNRKNLSTHKIIENIELILKAKISLEYNANNLLLIDNLLINLI